jgi:outer membrane immunogenic protein
MPTTTAKGEATEGSYSMKRDFLRCLAGAAAGVLWTGTSTFAADLGVAPPPPPPPPVFTWTGFELGVQVGGGAGETGVRLNSRLNGIPLFPPSDRYGSSGVFGGIHVGYNYQFENYRFVGPIVAGVQLEYNFAGITGTASAPPLNYLETSIRQFGSADGRLGVAFDRLLIYGIGGFAYGDIRSQIQLTGLAPSTAMGGMSAAASNIISTAIGRRGPNTVIMIGARGASTPQASGRSLMGSFLSLFPTTLRERPCRPAVSA